MSATYEFNCCPGGAEPDWSEFESVEALPTVTREREDGSTYTVRSPFQISQWTLFGTTRGGDTVPLHDGDIREIAEYLLYLFDRRLERLWS